MNIEDSNKSKKRLMFVKGDDFYFITYNILILLFELDCTSAQKKFIDHRKFAFLIDFISDQSLTQMVLRKKELGTRLSASDRSDLSLAYSRGASRQHLVMRLICALALKDYLVIDKRERKAGMDLFLVYKNLPENYLTDSQYEVERQNVRLLKKIIPQLRTLTFGKVLEQLFSVNGVESWHA